MTTAVKEYVDLDVLIESTSSGFIARLESEGGGQAQARFEPPFSQDELEVFLLRLAHPRRITRRIETPQMETAKAFGRDLFEALFAGELRACLRASHDDAVRQGKGLRIRIHPISAPELADVPWEFLFHGTLNRFLSLSTETPVVRFLDLPEAVRPRKVALPLKVLVAIAAPQDLVELDVDEEWLRLREAVVDLENQGVVALERLDHANLPELQHALRRGEYHVFHFVGHGGFDERMQDGVLMMEGPEGRGVVVGAQRLGTLLHDHPSLRLAVLNACEGARTDVADPFGGVAQTLVQQGVAAVIAMQFEFTDAAAIMLAHEFYGALADGYPIDAALAEGRKAIFNAGNDTEWATPVLHLRSPDGQLFDLQHLGSDDVPTAHVPVVPERPEALPLPPADVPPPPAAVPPRPTEVPLPSAAPESRRLRPFLTALAAAGGLALGFALPLYSSQQRGIDVTWYSFAPVAAPFGSLFTSLEVMALIIGVCVAALLALRPGWGPVSAGLLVGFGIAGAVKAASTVWWISADRAGGTPRSGAYLLLLAPLLAIVAGLDLRASTKEMRRVAPGRSVGIGLLGAALVTIAIALPRWTPAARPTAVASKWHELAYEAVAIAIVAVVVAILGSRTGALRFAGGLLVALGIASLFYWTWFAGLPTANFIRTRESWPLPGGFVGMAGALMLIAAGRGFVLAASAPRPGRRSLDG